MTHQREKLYAELATQDDVAALANEIKDSFRRLRAWIVVLNVLIIGVPVCVAIWVMR